LYESRHVNRATRPATRTPIPAHPNLRDGYAEGGSAELRLKYPAKASVISHSGFHGNLYRKVEQTGARQDKLRSYQTDEIRSQQWQDNCSLCGAELTPLSKSGGAVGFKTVSKVEMTFLVEMIANRGVDGDEFL
jgi:hypothetical protein